MNAPVARRVKAPPPREIPGFESPVGAPHAGWLALALAGTLLAGCGLTRVACKQSAPDVHIAPECLQTCALDPPVITSDPQSLLDAAVGEREALKQCEARRALCAQALHRAQEAGAVK